jgi:hypothetical protein
MKLIENSFVKGGSVMKVVTEPINFRLPDLK